MAISDRINEMYTHVGDVYDTITNVDLPTNKNIQNIPSAMRSSYLEIMNNGIDKIWNNWEKVTGSGADISLSPTLEAPMRNVLNGNTYQFTTTGKNLLPNNQTTQTINGLTFTVNGNKSITITGTATANTDYYFVGTVSQYVDFGLTTGNYNLSGCSGGSEQTYMLFAVMNRNGSIYYYGSFVDTGRKMIVETGDTFRIFIRVISGQTMNTTMYPMVERGDNKTTYEPYTNGASPNPNYPQDIHVVSGDNSINVCGKNLFDKDNEQWLSAYINGASATTLSTSSYNRTLYIPCEPNTTYTIQKMASVTNSRFNIACSVDIPAVGVSIYGVDIRGYFDTVATYTTPSNAKYLLVNYMQTNNTSTTVEEMLNSIQIEKGSQATTYEPYQSASYPVNLGNIELCKIGTYQDKIAKSSGKNLFNISTITENTYIDENGTTGSSQVSNISDYIEVKPNTSYTLSFDYLTLLNSTKRNVVYYNESKTYISGGEYFPINKTNTITTPNNAKYIRFSYDKNCYSIMLNEGTTALPYEPYGKVWYLNKQIGKVVLNGSESWTRYGKFGSAYLFYVDNITDSKTIVGSRNIGFGLSDYFTWALTSSNAEIPPYIRFQINNGKKLYLAFENDMTLEEFNAWLSTHNTTVYYILATPTDTEITDTTLLSQLEAVKKSYTTQTNISQENNDLPFILDVTALKQLTQ